MKMFFRIALCLSLTELGVLSTSKAQVPLHPKFGFPVYTNQASGKQLTGQHAPAGTPALSPEEAQRQFKVPTGFEVRLFAAEPDVVNPVAMSFDARGRLWVLELYEYPLGTKPGEKGRDRIKILEDTDNDGRVDKVTVFADGLTLATGLLVGNGGVYVAQAPHLYFMPDANGDDIADGRKLVMTGFGMEDRHELLNGLTWGPDGQMYMTHGVFTQSKVVDPEALEKKLPPVVLTAGVARFDPGTKAFEVFAEGTSNPWGVDFDSQGNAFVSACVIDHLFHLSPGGLYARQAGQPPFPYSYGLLPSIVDHKHHMAAYAGVSIYQGDQWPKEWLGEVFMGNIHQNAINHDHLVPNGATFKATTQTDFLTTKDGWFMPVSTQVGPDGAEWIMDWYDRYPCYQNANADPDGVDRERGRIWRVVWTGQEPGKPVPSHPANLDLGKASTPTLVEALSHSNVWQRRTAQRILSGRKDPAAKDLLQTLLRQGSTTDSRLAALWTLHSSGQLSDATLEATMNSTESALRAWAVRLTGERREGTNQDAIARIIHAAEDPDPFVRSAAATAVRLFSSGALTVDLPPKPSARVAPIGPMIVSLLEGNKNSEDPVITFLIWMAAEPMMARRATSALEWFSSRGMSNLPLSATILSKTMRRLCDERQPRLLDRVLSFLEKLPESSTPLLTASLDGLIEGQRGKALTPSKPTDAFINRLLTNSNPEVASRARQLGSLWGDAAAFQATLAKINDPSASESDRVRSIQSARQTKTDDTRAALYAVLSSKAPDAVKVEATRALSEVGNDPTDDIVLGLWKQLSPMAQRGASELLASKSKWALTLLTAIKKDNVSRGDIPQTVIRNLATHQNESVRLAATSVFGRVNATSAEKLRTIAEKRKMVISGVIDLEAGHEIAKKNCLICHKLFGEGAEIGPDLTGVGRSSLDALLHNVIHPNEIIGQGYENVVVETKDDRTVTGRLVENTDARIRLVMGGPQEEVIAKSNVKSLKITENSVMPEGLEQIPDAEFRNLIWFILAPPQDGKPLDEGRKKELINSGTDQGAVRPLSDGESIAMWNPEWKVICSPSDGIPTKLPDFEGRKNVLVTPAQDSTTPARLERTLDLAGLSHPMLSVWVAANENGSWKLRASADSKLIYEQVVGGRQERWQKVQIDLSAHVGHAFVIRLETLANDDQDALGYWSDIEIRDATEAALNNSVSQ